MLLLQLLLSLLSLLSIISETLPHGCRECSEYELLWQSISEKSSEPLLPRIDIIVSLLVTRCIGIVTYQFSIISENFFFKGNMKLFPSTFYGEQNNQSIFIGCQSESKSIMENSKKSSKCNDDFKMMKMFNDEEHFEVEVTLFQTPYILYVYQLWCYFHFKLPG